MDNPKIVIHFLLLQKIRHRVPQIWITSQWKRGILTTQVKPTHATIYKLISKWMPQSSYSEIYNTRYPRIEQNTEGQAPSDPCTSTVNDLLCSPWAYSFSSSAPWAKCSILLWQRCLQSHLVS